jgi:hypothetical protein
VLTPEQRRERGEKAARLIADETFQAAAREVDAYCRDKVFATKLAQIAEREALFAEYDGFRRILATLRSWKDDGALVAREIEP